MRIFAIFTFLIFHYGISLGQFTFEKILNEENGGTGYSVVQTTDGGYALLAGTGDGAQERINIVRTDLDGDTLWSRIFSGSPENLGDHAILQTDDGGFIVCSGMGDSIYLLRVSQSGDSVWGRNVCAGEARTIEPVFDSGYIICGDSNGILLVRTNQEGMLQWKRHYQPPQGNLEWYHPYSVKQTADSGYVITGTDYSGYGYGILMVLKTNQVGDSLWMRNYDYIYDSYGYSISLTPDNGFFICGENQAMGDYHAFAVKLDNAGDTVWFTAIQNSKSQNLTSCQSLPEGGYIACGVTILESATDSSEVLLVKFSESGEIEWSRTFGWYDKSKGRCVHQTSDNGFIIAGESSADTSGIRGIYLIKTDSAGQLTGIQAPPCSSNLTVFPNPAEDLVNFRFGGLLPTDDSQVMIYDHLGKKVKQGLLPKGQMELTMDIRTLTPGVYCYNITQNQKRQTGKLVVVR